MLSDLRFGLRLSAHSISERPSDASSVADRDGRQQPLLESVCDNGLVQDIHMASLIQYVEPGHRLLPIFSSRRHRLNRDRPRPIITYFN